MTMSNRRWLGGIFIVVLTLAVYLPAIRGGFVWDDGLHLINNVVFQENGLYRVWFTTDSFVYYPMVWTSYWLEYQFWGPDPAGYHVVNVLLHALSSVLIWRILLRLGIPAPWLAALIFALHPVNVESVAWITQRKNTLCMLFYVGALCCYLRHEDEGGWGLYVLAVFLFLLSMLSKGASVVLPAVLLLLAWWRRGRLGINDVLRSIPFFAVAGLMSFSEVWFQTTQVIGEDVVRDDPFAAHVAGAGWVVWFYLDKALIPIDLSFVYPRWQIDPTHWLSYVPNVMLILLLLVLWCFRRSWGRGPFHALGYFVLAVAPAMGFVYFFFLKYSFVADHYQYFSIIAVIALLVGTATHLASRYRGMVPVLLRLAAVLVLVLCGVLTWRQASYYDGAITLWHDTLKKNPDSWLAHNNLGDKLRKLGDALKAEGNELDSLRKHEEAIQHFREATRAAPELAAAYISMGMTYLTLGRRDDAIAQFHYALNVKPDFHQGYLELGIALHMQGRHEIALQMFHKALQVNPRYANAYFQIAAVADARGDLGEAEANYRKAIEIDPQFEEAHVNLGSVLGRQRRIDEAIAHFREALRIAPNSARAHYNLGYVYQSQGRAAKAIAHFHRAVELASDDLVSMISLARLLAWHPDADLRRPEEALRLAQRADRLTGHQDPSVLDALAAGHAATGQFEQAVHVAEKALSLARQTGANALSNQIRIRLQLYRQGKPYRLPVDDQGNQ